MRKEPVAWNGFGRLGFRSLRAGLLPGSASEKPLGQGLVLLVDFGFQMEPMSTFEHVPKLSGVRDPPMDYFEDEHEAQSGRTEKRGLMMSSVRETES